MAPEPEVLAQVREMLEARELTETWRCRHGGRGRPRRRMTTEARVEIRPVLNAAVLAELTSMDPPVDIVVHDGGRATAHTAKKCVEAGIEVWDRRFFEFAGGFASHVPAHQLVAVAEGAEEYVRSATPGLLLRHMPAMSDQDPAAKFFGAEAGELWQCDWDEDEGAPGAELYPPRRVVRASELEG